MAPDWGGGAMGVGVGLLVPVCLCCSYGIGEREKWHIKQFD